jgi:hypothetical protein
MKFGNLLSRVGVASVVTAALTLSGGAALAQDKPQPAAPAQGVKDERALKLLKAMSDTLAGSKTLAFNVRGLVPMAAPTGQYVSLFALSRVQMQRPDKLFVESRGDLFPSDLYFDGKTVTAVGAEKKFYAQRDAAHPTLDAFMQNALPGTDSVAPFFDLLVSDPFASLTKDFTSALWVGQSTLAGVKTDHLAFTAQGIDWELWIGSADRLPRMLVVSYRGGERQPTFTAEFSGWKLGAPIAASTFNAAIPKGAVRLEFKAQGVSQGK